MFSEELETAKKVLDITSTYVECMIMFQPEYEPTQDLIAGFMVSTQEQVVTFCNQLRELIKVLQIETYEEAQNELFMQELPTSRDKLPVDNNNPKNH